MNASNIISSLIKSLEVCGDGKNLNLIAHVGLTDFVGLYYLDLFGCQQIK